MFVLRGRNLSYFDDAYDVYFDSVSSEAGNKIEKAVWAAWGSGAIVIDGGLSVIPGFGIVPDNLDTAKSLINLFIQPMVSVWYNNWESGIEHSEEEKELARRIAFKNVQGLIGVSSQKLIDLHIELDKQLNLILDKEVSSSACYIGMFHQRYLECITSTQIMEWDKIQFPIGSYEEFLVCYDKGRYKELEMESSMATFAVIASAGAHMFKEFTRIYEEG